MPKRSSAVIDDGIAPHVPVHPVRVYEPRTKPGHPLPQAFVEQAGDRRLPGFDVRELASGDPLGLARGYAEHAEHCFGGFVDRGFVDPLGVLLVDA
jgi:hypothetical protein